jgi:hypothetical protein
VSCDLPKQNVLRVTGAIFDSRLSTVGGAMFSLQMGPAAMYPRQPQNTGRIQATDLSDNAIHVLTRRAACQVGLHNRVPVVPVGSDRKGHPGELLGHRPQPLADRGVV